MPQRTNFYSDEAQSILGRAPSWVVRWGITVVFLIFVGIIVGCYFIKYPDTIEAPAVITTVNPPSDLVARYDGLIDTLCVKDKELVERGELIAVLHNAAERRDVERLSEHLLAADTLAPAALAASPWLDGEYALGELQSAFADLQSRCRDYRHYLATDNIARKKELLREQIAKNREYYAKLERQRSLLLQDLDYGRRTLERDSLLLAEAVISAADYETTAQNYLSKQNAQAGFDATLTSTELQIIQSEQQLVELTLQQENETAEYERTLEQSRQQLAARIAQWRQQYVLEAPVTGRVTLVNYWSENQHVAVGDKLASIVPDGATEVIGPPAGSLGGFRQSKGRPRGEREAQRLSLHGVRRAAGADTFAVGRTGTDTDPERHGHRLYRRGRLPRRHDHVVPARAADDSADGRHGGDRNRRHAVDRTLHPARRLAFQKPISRMRRTYIVPLGLLLLSCMPGFAQERRWTLEECIAHAYEHNIEIKARELTAAEKRIALAESKWSYAPDLSVSNSSSLATGRVLDETTYEFVENETVAGNSSSLGANILLFGGLKNYYNLKRAQLDLRSSLLAVEKMRNDVRMNVTAYYLEVLCAEETIRDAEQVVAELRMQEEKTAKKVEARKVTTADLLQIRSQLADAENDVLTARNTYDIARLNLCQLLEIDDYTTFRTVAPDVGVPARSGIADSPAEVFDAARELPELEAARVGIDMARRDLQIARTAYWPTLSLSVGYGSSYSDVRQKMFRNTDGTYRYEAYPFFEQYKDNASSYVSLSLNIPIFGKFTVRKNVQRQKLAIRQAEYALRTAEKQVEKEVAQALIDARTAWERYRGAQRYVASAEEAARQIERKYDLGAATVTDYNAAVSAAVKARSQRLQAKYEYLFKIKTLTYYTNYDYGE